MPSLQPMLRSGMMLTPKGKAALMPNLLGPIGYSGMAGRISPMCMPVRTLKNFAPEDVKKKQLSNKMVIRTPTLFRPMYSAKDVEAVRVAHFKPESFSDKLAFGMLYLVRKTFDFITRYHHPKIFPRVKGWDPKKVTPSGYKVHLPDLESNQSATQTMELAEMRKRGICMTPEQWMVRVVFLETVAGIPGLVAAACRHLQSLRLMRRDKGWIHTLLEDSENERMHLLVAMEYVGQVGPFMRLMILAAQGVYWNMFFTAYLLAPKAAHRFVGALEEEAVITYTAIIQDIEQGRLPEWENLPAVDIAKEYSGLPESATMVDVIYAIRADEATHRFVNHTLGSLDPTKDFNPFANHIPSPQLRGDVAGLTREEAHSWALRAQKSDKNSDAIVDQVPAAQPSVMTTTKAQAAAKTTNV